MILQKKTEKSKKTRVINVYNNQFHAMTVVERRVFYGQKTDRSGKNASYYSKKTPSFSFSENDFTDEKKVVRLNNEVLLKKILDLNSSMAQSIALLLAKHCKKQTYHITSACLYKFFSLKVTSSGKNNYWKKKQQKVCLLRALTYLAKGQIIAHGFKVEACKGGFIVTFKLLDAPWIKTSPATMRAQQQRNVTKQLSTSQKQIKGDNRNNIFKKLCAIGVNRSLAFEVCNDPLVPPESLRDALARSGLGKEKNKAAWLYSVLSRIKQDCYAAQNVRKAKSMSKPVNARPTTHFFAEPSAKDIQSPAQLLGIL